MHILSSFVGLIGAFVALLVTNAVSDGLSIDGVDTWIFATLIVWGGMILADLLIGRRSSVASPARSADAARVYPVETRATATRAQATPTYWRRESRSCSTKPASSTVVTG